MKTGNKIKKVREALGLNQKQFAAEIHISASYMSEIESLKKEPSDTLADLIMEKWNVSEEWWESGDGPIFVKEDEILHMVLNEVRRQYERLAAGGAVVDKSKAGTALLEKLAELGRG